MGKSYSQYSISDVIRLKGGFVKKYIPKENIPDLLEACRYFCHLGTSAGVDVSNLSALDTGLITLRVGVPILPPGENGINKIFLDLKERIDQGEGPESLADESSIYNLFSKAKELGFTGGSSGDEVYELKEAIKRATRSIQDYQAQIDNRQSEIRDRIIYIQEDKKTIEEYRKKLEIAYEASENGLNPYYDELSDSLVNIQKSGIWDLAGVRYTTDFKIREVLFIAKNDIVMKRFNPALSLDDELNFGKLQMRFVLNGREPSAYIHAGKKAVKVTGYYHPNISSNGSICYGGTDLGTKLVEDLMNRKLDKFAVGIYQLLTTYSTDAPYIAHDAFKRRMDMIAEGRAKYGLSWNMKSFNIAPMKDLAELITEPCTCIKIADGSRYSIEYVARSGGGYYTYRLKPEDGGYGSYNIKVSEFNEEFNIEVIGEEDESVLETPCEGENNVPSEENNQGDFGARESEVSWADDSSTGSVIM